MHILLHSDCHKEYEKNRKREYRNYIQLLRSAPCACCGNQYHYLMMDFHHLDRSKKEIAVSDAISRGWSLSRIKKEIDKCIIMFECNAGFLYSML